VKNAWLTDGHCCRQNFLQRCIMPSANADISALVSCTCAVNTSDKSSKAYPVEVLSCICMCTDVRAVQKSTVCLHGSSSDSLSNETATPMHAYTWSASLQMFFENGNDKMFFELNLWACWRHTVLGRNGKKCRLKLCSMVRPYIEMIPRAWTSTIRNI
jgi:hypothetical protein